MMRIFVRRLALGLVSLNLLLFTIGCGEGSREDAVDSKSGAPAESRAHRYFSSKVSSVNGFGLRNAFPEILQISTLGASELASWILFDSRLMPRVEQPEPQSILHSWIETYGELIDATSHDEWLALAPRELDSRHRVFAYQRYVQGIPVRDNILQLILSKPEGEESWYLGEVLSNSTGALVPTSAVAEPALMDARLFDLDSFFHYHIAQKKREWISFSYARAFTHELATSFKLRDIDDNDYIATLTHSNMQVIEHYALSLHAQTKAVQARALKRSYLDAGPREYPLAFSTISGVTGAAEVGPEAWLPENVEPQVVTLSGARAMLIDEKGAETHFTRLQNQDDTYILANQSYDFASVNAFVAIQRINRFVRQFVSGSELPFLNSAVKVVANIPDGSCNAYYSPRLERILLYREGNECANMALINDVVFHEWGHALDDHSGLSESISDYAFSEGIADTLAAYHNDDPKIAPGFFFNDDTPVRSVLNSRQFPRDKSATTHFEGGIISGALWDMRLALIERYGKRRGSYYAGYLFLRHLLSVDSYVDSYAGILRLDDDDGRAETPSPNYCLLQKAFSLHGLAADSGCIDSIAQTPSKVLVDEDLALTLWEQDEPSDGVRLFASSLNAEKLAYCWTDHERCLQNPAERQTLELVSKQNAPRRFFGSELVNFPSERQTLTLLRLDAQGAVQGGRSFVIHNK